MFKFKIRPDEGEPFTVIAASRDIARWERTTKGTSYASLIEQKRIGDFYKIAFYAATRQRLWAGTLAEFEETCDFEVEDSDDSADPTQSAA